MSEKASNMGDKDLLEQIDSPLTHERGAGHPEPESESWREWLGNVYLGDVVSKSTHSKDFSGSRADFMSVRIRLLAFIFAILTPTWIPVDYYVLDSTSSLQLTLLRIVTAALFLALALISKPTDSLPLARLRLTLLLGIPLAFYLASRSILGTDVTENAILVGYTFLPFLLIVIPAVFPLTLLEGTGLSVLVIGSVLVATAFLSELSSIITLGDLWLLVLLASIATITEMSQLHALLRLYRQATVDPLTGLYNRRSLMHRFYVEVSRSERYERQLAVLLFDLDKFKRINDTHGHLVGDKVLKNLSEILTEEIRGSDFVGRYGGEEFLAVLPETDQEGAATVAERIRTQCEDSPLPIGTRGVRFTISAGGTVFKPGDDMVSLFNRVDELLYRAKEQGRNRIVFG